MTVLAWASDGRMALVEARRQPFDLIVLDLDMPILSGLAILPRLLLASPTARVLIVSRLTRRTAGMIDEALQTRPRIFSASPTTDAAATPFAQTLIAKARALGRGARARDSMSTHCVTHPSLAGVAHANAAETRAEQIIAIARIGRRAARHVAPVRKIDRPGRSTDLCRRTPAAGHRGPVRRRPGAQRRPPAPRPSTVSRWCAAAPVAPAKPADRGAGRLSVAVIRLRREGPASLYPGTIDAMLVSLAELCGAQLFAALLSGDGRDRVKGCRAVAEVGGQFVVQGRGVVTGVGASRPRRVQGWRIVSYRWPTWRRSSRTRRAIRG